MYSFKAEKLQEVKGKYKLGHLASIVGISSTLMSQIINGHRSCPKPTAFCITKMIDKEAEIEDYFNMVK